MSNKIDFLSVKTKFFEKICVWLLIISSIFGANIWNISIGKFHIFLFRIVLVFAWFLFALSVLTNQGRLNTIYIKVRSYIIFLFIFFSYGIFSLSWSISKIFTLRQLLFLFSGISLIFFIVYYFYSIVDLERFYNVWILVAVFLLIIGSWESLTGNHLTMSIYFTANMADRKQYIPTTVFRNPNDFGLFLGITFPFLLSWFHYKKGLSDKILSSFLIISAFYLLLNTGSRANMIAIFTEVAIFLFVLAEPKESFKFVLGLVLLFLLIGLIFPHFLQNIVSQINFQLLSLTPSNEKPTGSDAVRLNLAKDAIYYLIHSFSIGVGAGNIEAHIKNFSPFLTKGITNVHNWWLEILADYGLFIFIGYILFYFKLIKNIWHAWKNSKKDIEKIISESLLLSIIGFSIGSLSPSSIMAFKPQWLLFGFALAFLNYCWLKEEK